MSKILLSEETKIFFILINCKYILGVIGKSHEDASETGFHLEINLFSHHSSISWLTQATARAPKDTCEGNDPSAINR